MTTASRKAPAFIEGCFVQFIGIKWLARAAPPRVDFGQHVLNTPKRQFVCMALVVARGLLFAGYLGVAPLGPLELTLSPPRKGMPKEGFYV